MVLSAHKLSTGANKYMKTGALAWNSSAHRPLFQLSGSSIRFRCSPSLHETPNHFGDSNQNHTAKFCSKSDAQHFIADDPTRKPWHRAIVSSATSHQHGERTGHRYHEIPLLVKGHCPTTTTSGTQYLYRPLSRLGSHYRTYSTGESEEGRFGKLSYERARGRIKARTEDKRQINPTPFWDLTSIERERYLAKCVSDEVRVDKAPNARLAWLRGYSVANASQDVQFGRDKEIPRKVLHPNAKEWAQDVIVHQDDSKKLSRVCRDLMARDLSKSRWVHVLLWIMHHQPDLILPYLTASPFKPFYCNIYTGALEYFIGHKILSIVHAEKDPSGPIWFDECLELFQRIAKRSYFLPQRLVYRLVVITPTSRVEELLIICAGHQKRISPMTLLHIADELTRSHKFQSALLVVKEVVRRWQDKPRGTLIEQFANTLLRRCAAAEDGYRLSSALLPEITGMGTSLNLFHYNTMMKNAVEAGDFSTALSIYELIQKHGIEPDHYTYSILIKGCETSDDPVIHDTIARKCAEHAFKSKDRELAANYLHYHWTQLRKRRELPWVSWHKLLRLYQQLFQDRELWLLKMINGNDRNETYGSLLLSKRDGLHTMIKAYLQRDDLQDNQVLKFYRNFVQKATTQQPLFRLMKQAYSYNTILRAFFQRKALVEYAPDLVESMIRARMVLKSPPEPPFVVGTGPDQHTWNILLNGYLIDGQVLAAEKVIEVMRMIDLKLDLVSYNTLLKGYSRHQMATETGIVLRLMEKVGLQMDDYSWTPVGAITDRDTLMRGLTIENTEHENLFDSDIQKRAPVGYTGREDHTSKETLDKIENLGLLMKEAL